MFAIMPACPSCPKSRRSPPPCAGPSAAGRSSGLTPAPWPPSCAAAVRPTLKPLDGRAITGVRRRGKMLLVEAAGRPPPPVPSQDDRPVPLGGSGRARRPAHPSPDPAFPARPRAPLPRRPQVRLRPLPARRPRWTSRRRPVLGPEPLEIGLEEFRSRLIVRRGRLKSLLLNQAFLAGIGNIYADEILFERGPPSPGFGRLAVARPGRPASRPPCGPSCPRPWPPAGSSIRDYRDADGEVRPFQQDHRVYGRKGEPCPAADARSGAG